MFYISRGSIPPKRHIQHRKPDGNLFSEELVSRKGFSSVYSNLYHHFAPTAVREVGETVPVVRTAWDAAHRAIHVRTGLLASQGDAVTARVPLFWNEDCCLWKAHVDQPMPYLFRNGGGDEVLFVQSGTAELATNLGVFDLKPGDYAVIPRGIIWRLTPQGQVRLLVIETAGPVETPSRYRNEFGQLAEHSPYSERDIRTPRFVPPVTVKTEAVVKVKAGAVLQTYVYAHHPFDVESWDGYYFPFVFNISDFDPITGRIHQPPPVHQTFQAPGLVICSFVPRLFDYHPLSIPAPYAHSNVESEEILYYVDGEFMSRKGIELESITYHPMGLPHGPQPGKTEASIGKTKTNELAVMVDTFRPLVKGKALEGVDDPGYPLSWLE